MVVRVVDPDPIVELYDNRNVTRLCNKKYITLAFCHDLECNMNWQLLRTFEELESLEKINFYHFNTTILNLIPADKVQQYRDFSDSVAKNKFALIEIISGTFRCSKLWVPRSRVPQAGRGSDISIPPETECEMFFENNPKPLPTYNMKTDLDNGIQN